MQKTSKVEFIGIGVQRCGTTWIAECMRQHPEILFPRRHKDRQGKSFEFGENVNEKELLFFNHLDETGVTPEQEDINQEDLAWYLSRFPVQERGKIRGEYSPGYLAHPHSARRIHSVFPDVKLIVSLRNPVDMIYSCYWLENATRIRKSFEESLEVLNYSDIGMYCRNLKRYLDVFPREHLHIIFFEDIISAPGQVIKKLYRFLGVRDDFIPSVLHEKINQAQMVRSSLVKNATRTCLSSLARIGLGGLERHILQDKRIFRAYRRINVADRPYPPMEEETRNHLRALFRDDICRLETLTGRDLTEWK